MNVLQTIRAELKVPKSEWNSFGNYHFRSKESILEKLKPLLDKHDVWIDFKDGLVLIGQSIFMESKACLMKDKDETVYSAKGYALHAQEIKGMQPGQITGATASYAQKSALEALFLIDGAGNLDEMKPDVKIPKSTNSQSPESSAKGKWLNVGTTEYTSTLEALKSKKTTLEEVKKTYKLSKATESKILSEIK